MSTQIALILAILVVTIILFVTEKVRMDIVALMVMITLSITGLVTPSEAISGFSNPAVITVWAMFMISAGLSATGIAKLVGNQVLRLSGRGEVRLIIVIMVSAGVMSAFMNNVGVAAMMLPVVMDISRRVGVSPSRLLMPLALGSLLGGLMTLIGTPPNILISDALHEAGLQPFGLFDFAYVGSVVMAVGVLFTAFVARHLLSPTIDPNLTASRENLREVYKLRERLFAIQLSSRSALVGKTLSESRIGSALKLNVVAIMRNGQQLLAPPPSEILRSGDRILVQGREDHLAALRGREHLVIENQVADPQQLLSDQVRLAEVRVLPGSLLDGHTLSEVSLRTSYGIIVLAIRSGERLRISKLEIVRIVAGDELLIQATTDQLEEIKDGSDFEFGREVDHKELVEKYRFQERLMTITVPQNSNVAGQLLSEARLGDAFGLTVIAIIRSGELPLLMPPPEEELQEGDRLLVKGTPDELATLRALQDIEIERDVKPPSGAISTEGYGLVEVMLSPRTTLAGKTPGELHFRQKYGLNLLALRREGQTVRSNLRDMQLKFGDALLLSGAYEKIKLLGDDPDFVVLTEAVQPSYKFNKAPLAGLILLAVLTPVILGLVPISIAAVAGATLMVLTRCLAMEEAYRAIEWPAVFLIAGMLPMGIAMEKSGAASFLAEGVIASVGALGPRAVIAGLFIITSLGTQIIPTAALVVLMAPIALNTAQELGLSQYALMMTVAVAASASFASPVSHPANLMVMGPGGYRFIDYLKVGLPLTLVVFIVVVVVLPVFWPLR